MEKVTYLGAAILALIAVTTASAQNAGNHEGATGGPLCAKFWRTWLQVDKV